MPSPSAVPASGKIARDCDEGWIGTRLEGVLQSIGDGVVVQEGTGPIVWANEAAARMAGAESAADLVGCSAGSLPRELTDEAGRLLDPGDLPSARLLRGEPAGTTLVRLRDRESGRVSWATVGASLVPGQDGRPPLAASIWRDVTDERRREESARYLARATNVLSESLDYGATLTRLARVIVPEFADWYCVDVLEGGELQPIAVEHANPALTPLARELHAKYPSRLEDRVGLGAVVRTGRSVLATDADLALLALGLSDEDRQKLGQLSPSSLMMVPLKAREQTFGAMKVMWSMESRRRYDEVDLATAEELGRRVGIAIENARAYREAREAIRLRDEFLAIAGHELRTPLTALKLQLQVVATSLERGRPPSDPAEWASRLEKTLCHADRLQQLIDRLLDVSHIASHRFVLERQETDLAELWRQVIERHAAEAARAGSVVSFTSTGRTVGQWDRSRIDQVFTSLLGNALKYGQARPVQVSLQGDGSTVKTVVRDEGIGIDPSAQARMFGRFERAVSVRNYGGFGLGLWIARELVEAHGGTVGFESQPGQGSTFWVELPCGPG